MMYHALPFERVQCKEDPRWQVPNPGGLLATEIEVMECLFGLVRAAKPNLVVETGCYLGYMTRVLAEACYANGHGRVVSCDIEPEHVKLAKRRCRFNYLMPYVDIRHSSALELPELKEADFLFSDSSEESRLQEIEFARRDALIVLHDTVTNGTLRSAALMMDHAAFIKTARGLTIIGRP